MNDTAVWLLILGMGIITYALRLSFIFLLHRVAVPPLVTEALRYVPPAVLSAIILPELFRTDVPTLLPFLNIRLVAGLVAILVAWRTRNAILTIGAGMIVLWILQGTAVR
ncbi:MAG: AzlD domain-containing protein [Anaerolineae bacterium]